MEEGIFAAEARHLGKRARTRARLMDAAVRVFARVGYEAASVNEITQAAEVANGTFYTHFRDKEELVAEVAFAIAADVARRLDVAMTDVDDAVERTSMATRQFLEFASGEPEWGWALFRGVWFVPELRREVLAHMRADLDRGVAQGAFKIEIDSFTVDTIASMVLAALFGRLRGEVGPEAGSKVAELQLRMLGVSPARAHRVAWQPLLPLELRRDGMG